LHDTRAVSDVVGYARAQNDPQIEQETYKVQYPRMGAEGFMAGGPFVPFWWGGAALRVGGAAVGHVTGRAMAAHRTAQLQAAAEPGATETARAENSGRYRSNETPSLAGRPQPDRVRQVPGDVVPNTAVGQAFSLERLPKP
jgi:hypothetical protein